MGGREGSSRAFRSRLRAQLWLTLQLVLLVLVWAAFLVLQLLKDRYPDCSKPYAAM